MNLPNKLTLSRLLLLPLIIILLYEPYLHSRVVAFILFLFLIGTDWFDGYFARKKKMTTLFGAFLDPTIDKIVINCLFICLLVFGLVDAWMVILMLIREFLVQGIRNMAISQGAILKSEFSGKIKAALQMFTISIGLFVLAFNFIEFYILVWLSMLLTLIIAYYALGEFLYKNMDFLVKAQEVTQR